MGWQGTNTEVGKVRPVAVMPKNRQKEGKGGLERARRGPAREKKMEPAHPRGGEWTVGTINAISIAGKVSYMGGQAGVDRQSPVNKKPEDSAGLYARSWGGGGGTATSRPARAKGKAKKTVRRRAGGKKEKGVARKPLSWSWKKNSLPLPKVGHGTSETLREEVLGEKRLGEGGGATSPGGKQKMVSLVLRQKWKKKWEKNEKDSLAQKGEVQGKNFSHYTPSNFSRARVSQKRRT